MPSAPPEPAAARFRTDLEALTGPEPGRIGLAVSGGPDSLAMLLLAHAAGIDCEAATVDHGFRAEAADEALLVARLCEQLGIAHRTLRPAAPILGSTMAAARTARYALLEGWRDARGLGWIATAHHADDQAETLLMRLNRGAGLSGLAAIRAVNGRIVRPLLGWRRAKLAKIAADAGVEAAQDPSNRDDRFDRARLRKALATAPWLDPAAIAASAAHLAQAEEALEWSLSFVVKYHLKQIDKTVFILMPGKLPPELLRRLFVKALAILSPSATPSGPDVARALGRLRQGSAATLAGTSWRVSGRDWHGTPAPPRKNRNSSTA